jgi:hypothetical protein
MKIRNIHRPNRTILTGLLALCLSSQAYSDVIYTQTFDNPGSGNDTYTNLSIDWKYFNYNGEDKTATETVVSNGDIFYTANQVPLTFTEELSLDTSEALTFSWTQRNNDTFFDTGSGDTDYDANHLVIKIGSAWYVTTVGYTNNTETTTNEIKSYTFSHSQSDWSVLNFDEGNAGAVISIGDPLVADLASDSVISAFGIFVYDSANNGDAKRFDTFTVDGVAIPELSSSSLLLGLAAMGMLMIRSRRRSVK